METESHNTSSRSISDAEMCIFEINKQIPLKHLNLMYSIDKELDDCIATKLKDICNIVEINYGRKYEPDDVASILNLVRFNEQEGKQAGLFPSENINKLINNYASDTRFMTHASLHAIKPFTCVCLTCGNKLQLESGQVVNVFMNECVETGMIYRGRCCGNEYYPKSYVTQRKRMVTHHSSPHHSSSSPFSTTSTMARSSDERQQPPSATVRAR
ncbi:unnamed protein product [Didymodactylos carnosus]|uniref:Uncharacterized protein n=1 Tax=Didymodactylos carnosus TaxID=1234261 RepID=A0A8S2FNM5_9BILA|nr:unnamed protein product [Didymodactylos carnosus]CAF4306229.1 unnamed protein product [Didymodactylos carnosus]